MNKKIKRKKWLRLLMPFIAIMGFNGLVFAGPLNPSGPPAPTMRTLEEITPAWNKKLPDSERFVDALDGNAVLDEVTGLVWDKLPSSTLFSWIDAIEHCYSRAVDYRKGWRLPTVEQLSTLLDDSQSPPTLPTEHPFKDVQSSFYWSTTTDAIGIDIAWGVSFLNGQPFSNTKTRTGYVWCVRSGL